MIGEYQKDEKYLAQIGNHPRIWKPTEAQVRYMVRKCRDSEKGFNIECENRTDGRCPFCCTEGCRRINCDWGLAEHNREEMERVKRENRPDDIRQNYLTTYVERFGCDPETRRCQPIVHAKGRICPPNPNSGIDRDWHPNPPVPDMDYNPDHILPSVGPSIYSKASFVNPCHNLNRGWPRRPYMLSEKQPTSFELFQPLAGNACCYDCQNIKVHVAEKDRSSRPTMPPAFPPPCNPYARSNLPSVTCPRVRLGPGGAENIVQGKWPGTFGDIPAKFLGQIIEDRKACMRPCARTSFKCPFHHSHQFPLEKKNWRAEGEV